MSAAGWHHDPTGKYEFRWWNGTHWTTDVASHGITTVDPMPHDPVAHPLTQPPLTPPPAVTPPPPTMAQRGLPPPTPPTPTLPTPAAAAARTWPTPPVAAPRRRPAALLGGAAALVALGVGAFVVLGGDDAPSAATTTSISIGSTLESTTSPPPTLVTSTTLATTTSTTAAPTTQPAPIDVRSVLLVSMPTVADVPADWLLFEGSEADPAMRLDTGYCAGPNWAAAAADQGAVGMIHGPNWDLPNGGWFGLSAFTFATTDQASAYLAAIDQQANGCMTDPVVVEIPETEYDIFADGFGEDALWTTAEVNAAFPADTTDADETVLVIYEEFISTSAQGTDFSLVRTEFQRFERHGRTVVAYWLWGEHDAVGFGNADAATSYTPTEADLDAAAAVIRGVVVGRLRAGGVL